MKSFFPFLIMFFCLNIVYSQQNNSLLFNVKGTLIDSLGETVIGARVQLRALKDTILTSSDVDGKFSFSNVRSSNFSINIRSLGLSDFNKTYNFPIENTLINIPIISLKAQTNMLDQIIVNGTPTITFKTDTTEYRAGDYNVRVNASVEDLVKKMEGLEVDNDGKITVKGETVVRARINGKDYFGGDVAKAIKDLPAEIVDKIQIVDDYGDQATKTGIKDGDPEKVINIITRVDKKVGNRANMDFGFGSSNRYNANIAGNRFNGNQQIGFKLSLNNTVIGVGNNSGESGGTRQTGEVGVYFNDDISEKIKFNGSYNFNNNNVNSLNNSSIEELNQIGTIFSVRDGSSQNKSTRHNLDGRIEFDIDSATWLNFRPEISFQTNNNLSNNTINQTGILRQDQKSVNLNNTTTPSYNFRLNAGHRFNKKGTTLSFEIRAGNNNNDQFRDASNNIIYYDSLQNSIVKDSLLNRRININNISQNYQSELNFSQPVSENGRIEFEAQINYRGYDNNQITNTQNNFGEFQEIDSLSRIFNYSFTENRYGLSYRFRNKKYNYTLGLTAVPGLLKGQSGVSGNITRRNSFNLIPNLRLEYQWSKQKRLSFRYYGSPQEPSYDQIQDVPDVTNPQNPVIGNPNLKTAFRNYLRLDFNNYIIDSKITIYARVSTSFTKNQVIRNNTFVEDSYNSLKRVTRFANANGNYNYNGEYNFSKRFKENTYGISFNGNIDFNNTVSLNRDEENIGKTWSFRQRLGLDLNPKEWLEITPNIRYNTSKTDFSLASSRDNKNSNLALSVEGKTFFIKTLFLSYDVSKNYVKGISANIANNPFIVNAGITKEFFKKRNGSLSLRVYDLLNQNNFVSRRVTENAIIDTRSNALSQYFILSVRWSPQKWSGGSSSEDRSNRNGDGSYAR
jgi:hypothetical protein